MAARRTKGEGGIYYDEARGRWVGEVRIDGRRRRVSAKNKTDAAAALGRLIHGDQLEAKADRRVTVGALITDWKATNLDARAHRGEVAPSTVETHAWACRLWTEQLGRTRATDLDVVKIETALKAMRTSDGKNLSRASMIKLRSTLRQVLTWAERRRLIAHNPATAVELPTSATEGTGRRALTADEVDALLGALTEPRWGKDGSSAHPLRVLFLVSVRLGLRPGEASALAVDALDLDGDPPTLAVIRGVQLKRGRPHLSDDLKTTGSRRTLAIPADVAGALRDHLAAASPASLLWPAPDGGPLWPSTIRGELDKACEAAGIARVRPNELRHTAATRLADAGLQPHVLADYLGHNSTRMLDEVYRHRPAVIHGANLV